MTGKQKTLFGDFVSSPKKKKTESTQEQQKSPIKKEKTSKKTRKSSRKSSKKSNLTHVKKTIKKKSEKRIHVKASIDIPSFNPPSKELLREEHLKLRKDLPWVEKYRPLSTIEMFGVEEIISKLKTFIEEFFSLNAQIINIKNTLAENPDPKTKRTLLLKLKSLNKKFRMKKARILLGPPGVGKTTIVYALARDFGLSVIELNASDVRTEDALNTSLGETVRSRNLLTFTDKKKKGKIILIDEVDGLHGQSDRGGVSALEKIILTSKYPIIMTCNFRDDQKFKKLYDLASPLIEVPPASKDALMKTLQTIAEYEGIDVDSKVLEKIVIRSNGDFRSAINDLQALAQGQSLIKEEDVESLGVSRDIDADIVEFFKNFMVATQISSAKKEIDEVLQKNLDFRQIHRWINENLLDFFKKPTEYAMACEILAYADHVLGYTLRIQDYSHLSYFFDILAAIPLAKTSVSFPKIKIKAPKFFRTRAPSDDPNAKILQDLYRISLDDVMRTIKPRIKTFLSYDPSLANFFAKALGEEDPKKVLKLFGK